MSEPCLLRKGIFDRWFIFHPRQAELGKDSTRAFNFVLAWSGSRWVNCGYDGVPDKTQVCNFETEREARKYCRENGLEPL